MDTMEKQAFMNAYATQMAYLSQQKVKQLLDENSLNDDMDYSPDEITVFDALGIWDMAIKFAMTQKGAHNE